MDAGEMKRNFENHGFAFSFFETKEEATAYLAEKIQGRSVGFGSSMTADRMGLYEALSAKNAVVWHQKTPGDEVRQLGSHVKVYITSANAIAKTGGLVNIDGTGNRIAMTLYGPEQVYYVVGRNKIAEDMDAAVYRAKNVASPQNARRLKRNTPCAVNADRCYDCDCQDRICSFTLIMERAPMKTPSEIVLINEDLGF
ncbi:MAG: lactate utilization protein [Christensenellales bacterium]